MTDAPDLERREQPGGETEEIPVQPGDEWTFYLERFRTKVHCNTDIPERFTRLQDYLNAARATDRQPLFKYLPIRNANWFSSAEGDYRRIGGEEVDTSQLLLPIRRIFIAHGYQPAKDTVRAGLAHRSVLEPCPIFLFIDRLSHPIKGEIPLPEPTSEALQKKMSEGLFVAITNPSHEKLEEMFGQEEHWRDKGAVYKPEFLLINTRAVSGVGLQRAGR